MFVGSCIASELWTAECCLQRRSERRGLQPQVYRSSLYEGLSP